MSRCPIWSRLVLGLGLLSPLGCATLPIPGTDLVPVSKVAEPVAKASLELPPDRAAELCLVTAQELEKQGHEAEAILQYEKARQHNPRLTHVCRRLAVLYDRQCDYPKALAEYKLALKLSPRDANLLNDLGYCHYERGDWAEAEEWLREALAIDPSHERAWTNLGLVLAHQERYSDSYEAFAKVVNPAEARSNVGILLAKQGKLDQAKEALRQALTLDPELKPAQVVLARLEAPPAAVAEPEAESGGVPESKEPQ